MSDTDEGPADVVAHGESPERSLQTDVTETREDQHTVNYAVRPHCSPTYDEYLSKAMTTVLAYQWIGKQNKHNFNVTPEGSLNGNIVNNVTSREDDLDGEIPSNILVFDSEKSKKMVNNYAMMIKYESHFREDTKDFEKKTEEAKQSDNKRFKNIENKLDTLHQDLKQMKEDVSQSCVDRLLSDGRVLDMVRPDRQSVVDQLLGDERFQDLVRPDCQDQLQTDVGNDPMTSTPSSNECRRCRCKYRCRCICHNDHGIGSFRGRWGQWQLRQGRSQMDDKSDADVSSHRYKNDFLYESGISDNELPVKQNSSKQQDKRPVSPKMRNEKWYHALPKGNIASGGGSGEPPDDDPSSDEDSDDNKQGRTNKKQKEKEWVIDSEAWEACVTGDFESEAIELLNNGKLPSQTILDHACLIYTRRNPQVKAICKCISEYIKNQSNNYLDVWPAYQYEKPIASDDNNIVFVIVTSKPEQDHSIDFKTYKRRINEITTKEENIKVTDKEREDPLDADDFNALQGCLKDNAKKIMDEHTNLTRVSVSWFKSSAHGTSHYKLEKKPCITLCVQIKGYVPLDEKPFPETIGGFEVDVREDVFIMCGQGPKHWQTNLKMGCEINGGENIAGTLGAFIELENDERIFALTSAHVLIEGENLTNILKEGFVEYHKNQKNAYQPPSIDTLTAEDNRFGCIVVALYNEGGNEIPGMEIALIEVTKRHPKNGTFPDDPECLHKRFGQGRPFEFSSGKIIEYTQLSHSLSVYKYGCESRLTEGLCRVDGVSIRTRTFEEKMLNHPMTLHGQIEVESTRSVPFGVKGDSGALVLTQNDNNDLLAVGIFEGSMNGSDYFAVSPIQGILSAIENRSGRRCRLKPLQRSLRYELSHHLADSKNEVRQSLEQHKNEIKTLMNTQKDDLAAHKNNINHEIKKLTVTQSDMKNEMTKQSGTMEKILHLIQQNNSPN